MPRRRRLTEAELAQHKADAERLIGEPLLLFTSVKGMSQAKKIRRAAQMQSLYEDHGWTLDQVGQAFGMTRERVRQIFNDYHIEIRGWSVAHTDHSKARKGAFLRRAKEKLDAASEDSTDLDVQAIVTLPSAAG